MGYLRTVVFISFAACSLLGQDITQLALLKGASYQQTSDQPPALIAGKPYLFEFFANGAFQYPIGGTLQLPNRSIDPLPSATNNVGNDLELQSPFPSSTDLDASFPTGIYSVILDTVHEGRKSISISFPLEEFPPAPQVKEFQSVQAIDPANDLKLEWYPLPGGTTNDFVQASINSPDDSQTPFQTPQFREIGALNGTSTDLAIPSNTLARGSSYRLNLLFARIAGIETNNGFGFSAYFSQTSVQITTAGMMTRPTIVIKEIRPSQWQLHANGSVGQNYLIESTSSLNPPIAWLPMVNFVGSISGFDFTDGEVASRRFYRIRPVN